MVARALDHIVWPARDLDGLAETFRRLGFTVGRRNRHPWGTVNHIVQFDGCFLELLGFAEDYVAPEPDAPASPFAGFCGDFLACTPGGAAMLVLRSDDAVADARSFREKGIGRGRVLPFSRVAQRADGSDGTVSFTIAFANLPGFPELGAFVCQQHRPENFWDRTAQQHVNGASGVVRVVAVAADPAALLPPLLAFAGQQRAEAAERGEMVIPLPNAALEIRPRPEDGQRAAVPARLDAVWIATDDPVDTGRLLGEAGFSVATDADQVVVSASEVGGTNLVFCRRTVRLTRPPRACS